MSKILMLFGWSSFFLLALFVIGFLISFFREKEWHAFFRGIFLFGSVFIIYGAILLFNFAGRDFLLGLILLVGLTLAVIFIFPAKQTETLKITGQQNRMDERDALFHRFYRIQPGSKEFDTYYREHPEKKEIDETIRKLPALGNLGGKGHFTQTSAYLKALFSAVAQLSDKLDEQSGTLAGERIVASTAEFTTRIRGFAKYLGADLVGMTRLNPAYIYSHIGRAEGEWGAAINLPHPFAIVVAVEMDYEMIKHAPENAVATDSSFRYFEAAKIAVILANYINMLGYQARAHVDGNYRVMCIPIAVDAGLGELGRLGLLITPQFGPRVRLAAVTTDLALIPDAPVNFGVQHFCTICKKCAVNCPTNSIEPESKKIVNNVEKWQSLQESCFRYWRVQGSDCSICIKVCPYSKPNSPTHNLIRWLVRRNNFARQLVFRGDRFFYGKRNRTKYQLPDWHKNEKL